MLIVYNIIISLLAFLSPVIGIFMPKFRERQIASKKEKLKIKSGNLIGQTIWFHSASMGEFEQAKPIIEKIKETYYCNNKNIKENIKIVCTFFSPSGYNTQKEYSFADDIMYLPLDTYWNSNKFINEIKPDIAIFIRYELWLNYLYVLNRRDIPIFLINATIPQNLTFGMRKFYRYVFNLISEIYTVSEKDSQRIRIICSEKISLLSHIISIKTKKNGTNKFFRYKIKERNDDNGQMPYQIFPHIYTATDTRIDRIIEKVETSKINPLIPRKTFNTDDLILVCGSIWDEDIDVIYPAINNINSIGYNISLILVPHEPTEQHIRYIKKIFPRYIILSEFEKNNISISLPQGTVMIVDSIGKLLRLYGIADLAYIGGAFGAGVHSLIEPAGYGIPLVCGKKCFNSPDALRLIDCEALTSVEKADELYCWLKRMLIQSERKKAGAAAKKYIYTNGGSTKKIVDKILENLNNTSTLTKNTSS